MMKNKRLFLMLIILVVLTVALSGGYLVYSKFFKASGSPVQSINRQQPTPPAPSSVINATNFPVFGVQVVFGKNPVPNQAFLSPLNVKATTLWLYYPTGGGGQAWIDSQKQLVESTRQKTGLDIYVHIMPNNPTKEPAFHMPSNMTKYTKTLTDLAIALKPDGVRYYSIGNEFSGYTWAGTIDDYVSLLRESGLAIKAGNPDALILDSGMAGQTYAAPIAKSMIDTGDLVGALGFTQQFLKNFSSYPVPKTIEEMQISLQSKLAQDILAWHSATFTKFCPYYDIFQLHDYQGWETMTTVYDWIKTQMQKNNCTKPIQFWELGYGLDTKKQIDFSEQARSVVKTMAIAVAEGTQMINYFPLKGTGNMFRGLLDEENQLLSAGIAFQVTAKNLSGVTKTQKLNLGNNVFGYKYSNNEIDIYVVWSLSDVTVQLPFNGSATITDIQGNSSKINSNQVLVSTSPIFVQQ